MIDTGTLINHPLSKISKFRTLFKRYIHIELVFIVGLVAFNMALAVEHGFLIKISYGFPSK